MSSQLYGFNILQLLGNTVSAVAVESTPLWVARRVLRAGHVTALEMTSVIGMVNIESIGIGKRTFLN